MKTAYFDCFGGASGDMLLGALLDAGADRDAVNSGLAALGLGLRVTTRPVVRAGLAGLKATVLVGDAPADPGEAAADSDTAPPEHHHRGLREIKELLADASGLPEAVRTAAVVVFERLAVAEAAVHGTSPEEVHFHEVGAADAIGDIVGTCLCLHLLGVERVLFGRLPTGGGTVRAAHGVLPVPAPATLQLLTGIVVTDPGLAHEMVTPTGAALLVALGRQSLTWPDLTIEPSGVGAGTRDTARANILRVAVGQASAGPGDAWRGGRDTVVVAETNLDDTSGQVVAAAVEALLTAGALDAWWQPAGMKKGRPAVTLSFICPPEQLVELARVAFAEVPTLGLRYYAADRLTLSREHRTVQTEYGGVRVKVGTEGERTFATTPEFEDCRALAVAAGVPVRAVIASAAAADANLPD